MRFFLLLLTISFSACSKENEDTDYSIRPVYSINTNGKGIDLEYNAEQKLLAVSSVNNGVLLLQTNTPERPIEIASINSPYVYRTALHEKTALVFDENFGLSSVDLRNLNNLNLTPELNSAQLTGYIYGILVSEGILYTINRSVGINSYSIKNSFELLQEQVTNTTSAPEYGSSFITTLNENILVATRSGYISTYTKNKGKVSLKSTFPTNQSISDFQCDQTFCFTTSLSNGINFFETNDKEHGLKKIRTLTFDLPVEKIYAEGEVILASYLDLKSRHGIYAIDFSNKQNPYLKSKLPLNDKVVEMKIIGGFIYILQENGELEIYRKGDLI